MLTARKLAFGTLLMSQVVMAQTPPVPPPGEGAPPPIDVQVQGRPKLSPADMVAQGNEYRQKMEEVLKRIEGLVSAARKQKDIIRLNCLTDKLIQVRANLNVADKAARTMQESIARADEGATIHEYTRLTIIHQNVQVLSTESEACIGEDLSYVGETRVDVDMDGVPDGDPTQPPDSPLPPDVDRPPTASPYI